jgi:hypothetical protein
MSDPMSNPSAPNRRARSNRTRPAARVTSRERTGETSEFALSDIAASLPAPHERRLWKIQQRKTVYRVSGFGVFDI